jgi:hypothetical protein
MPLPQRIELTLRQGAGVSWLHAVVSGEFSLPGAKRMFLDILAAMALHQTTKLLFDGRAMTGDLSTMERFLYGAFVAHAVDTHRRTHGTFPALQFAYVLHEPVLDPKRFGETVAVNRGMWVHVFDNPEDACVWLGLAHP